LKKTKGTAGMLEAWNPTAQPGAFSSPFNAKGVSAT
jgi:hypothetical protein